jgi:phage shock protein PspC (stress-responsive transcriptional regulator)
MQSYKTSGWFLDKSHRMISGVCAGLARYYQLPRWGVRCAAVLLALTFPLLILAVYVLAVLILPARYPL